MQLLKQKDLEALIERWGKNYVVYAPTRADDDVLLLPYSPDHFTLDYVNFTFPVKEYLFEQKEQLFKWIKKADTVATLDGSSGLRQKQILFGVRSCDAYGIAYLDRFYQEEFTDSTYAERRANTWIVAVNCTSPAANCFCSSTGTGPFADRGYDLLFTPFNEYFLVETGTAKGNELLALAGDLLLEEPVEADAVKKSMLKEIAVKFTTVLNLANIADVLEAAFNDPLWSEISKICIGCTGCTNVCPTCTCFNVVEENSSCQAGCRVRYWDSCQSDSFTRNAGNHNPRDGVARVRYRIYDKLKYIEERFNYKGCTGCGRCITACPVFINIVEIASQLCQKYPASNHGFAASAPGFEIKSHDCTGQCANIYTPQVAVIKEIIEETKDIKRFILQYEDKSLHKNFKFTGQFFEITVFGVGEIAISIPFGPSQQDYFDFCVKKVGKVTSALHSMHVGDKVGLRGPFGKGFPFEEIKGKDILIIGSGVGLAPVRTMLVRILENQQEFGKVVIIASATSYEGLIYKDDLIRWSNLEKTKVLYALSKPTTKVNAHVGYINDLLPDLELNWHNTTAVICASPRRIKAVAKDLLKLGMQGTDILTSLETHMRCGIGKCGHCKVGSKYMCVDGPVFNYAEMLQLPPEF